MGLTKTYHRPLVSGIAILSAKTVGEKIEILGSGTLTGLATRNSDNKKVLVTNLHVMTGSVQTDPSGVEEMYQLTNIADQKVGADIDWVPIAAGQDNIADVAMCELEGFDGNVSAEFTLHDYPTHSRRRILVGVVEPVFDEDNPMKLTMMGASNGEGEVTVKEVGKTRILDGRTFTGLTILDCSKRLAIGGDSGSACLYKVGENQYKVSCIVFGREVQDNPVGREGWAFPASVAERELGITFGKRSPTAHAGMDQLVNAGAMVTLDGSKSSDPDRDMLTYSWSGPTGTTLAGANTAKPTFTAPTGPAKLEFTLTVTHPYGLTASDMVTVTVLPANVQPLGTLSPGGSIVKSGVWTSGIESENRPPGRYARYYAFRVGRRARFQIDLESEDADAYLYLLSGEGVDGEVLDEDDDFRSSTHSRVVEDLDPGAYTIEATTYAAGWTGEFTLRVEAFSLTPAVQSSDATLKSLTLSPSSASLTPAFVPGTASYTASVGNAVSALRVTPTVPWG